MDIIVTSEVRFSFVNLFKPRKNDQGKEKYGVTLLFPHPSKLSGNELVAYNACIASLKAQAKLAATEKWGAALEQKNPDGSPKLVLRTPFRDQGDKDYDGYEPGAIFLNVTSEQRPEVVDHNVQPILESGKVYSGCYGRASLRAFAYDNSGNKGVSFGLQNVQKTRDGEPLGGRSPASADFQPIAAAAEGAGAVADATKLFG